MKKTGYSFKINFLYGLMVVIPLGVLVLLIAKVVEILQLVALSLKLDSTVNAVFAIVIALVLLLLICFGIGTMVRTRIGTWSFEKLEQAILRRVPGYEFVGNILKGFAKEKDAYPAVMVRLHGPGSAVFGLVMEDNQNGVLTVFLPSAPALTVGSLHVVRRDRVTYLEASTPDVVNSISQWGIGSREILGDFRP